MRKSLVEGHLKVSGTSRSMKNGFLCCSKWAWLLLLAIAMMAPYGVRAQLAGTGAISGTVTDATGAVIPDATVTAIKVETNVATVRITTHAGDYNITPLTPGTYTVIVVAKGFEKYVQKNVTVDALQTVAVNMKLTVGTAQETITITDEPPVLETTSAQLGAVMDNEMYTSLPLLMGASGQPDQRRATDFSYLMPGVQNTYQATSTGANPTDATGGVNGSNPGGGTSEIYIDGINLPEGDGIGDPRYTWTAFGTDSIDQFQVETAGYSSQYAGQGVQNYSIKSGGNKIHGSVYEFIRNTVLDAWAPSSKFPTLTGHTAVPAGGSCSSAALSASTSWCALGGVKPAEIMNEYGIVISGPIIKNKLFLFYNYGQYRNAAGPKPQVQTVPTMSMMGYTASGGTLGYSDFSGYAQAASSKGSNCVFGPQGTSTCYDIYDPGTQTTPNCTGASCQRSLFQGTAGQGVSANGYDVIQTSRLSHASQYYNAFMANMQQVTTANQSAYVNNATIGYASGLSNWYQSGRLDYNQSEKNQVSLIIAFGRQSVAGGYGLSGGAANSLPPPFNTNQFYAPQTNVDILKDTWTINAHLVNQAALAFGRYKSQSKTQDYKPIYSATASGLLNTPPGQPTDKMPGIAFSPAYPSVGSPENEANYSWHGQLQNTYTATDSLQWESGKHNVTFGGQAVYVQFNLWTTTNASPLQYTFNANQTAGYTTGTLQSSSSGASFASYMLGAVGSSSVSLAPEWGARWMSPSIWAQDSYKVTSKLTLNLGLRWDIFGSIHEVHDQWTWLNPKAINLNTGNYGTLAFAGGVAGNGPYTGLHSPSPIFYKSVAPRLGLAYAIDHKTVIRASYDLAYARGNWTAGGGSQKLPSQMGLLPSASAAAGVSNAPSFYWDGTACTVAGGGNGTLAKDGITPCGWTGSTSTPATVIAQEVAAGRMPQGATLANFGTAETALEKNTNNGSPGYFDSYLGSRSPEYINWTFGIQRALTKNISATVTYVGSEGHFISASKAIGARNNELPESMAALAGYNNTGGGAGSCSGLTCTGTNSLLAQKATVAYLAMAAANGFAPPNPYTSTANYYASNAVNQYYQPFPQYSGLSDQTSFVGNENWNALEVSVRARPASGLNFMVNYTWSKSIDDLGTFRVGDNTRLERSISAASQPQNLIGTAVYHLPLGRNHKWGDNFVYRSIVSDWQISGIGLYHSGLPILVLASGCGGSGILNQCMPSVVAGQSGRQNSYNKTASGTAVSWDSNAANYIGKVQYINPAAFTVITQGTTGSSGYTSCTGSATTVCNGQAIGVGSGPASYVPGNASRVAPIKDLWSQSTYNVDLALKRTFPIYRVMKLALEIDMSNVTNHVVLKPPSTTVAAGANSSFGTISGIANYPRDVQASARISW